jgi:hypothetical protein
VAVRVWRFHREPEIREGVMPRYVSFLDIAAVVMRSLP